MKQRKIVITDKNRSDFGVTYNVYNVFVIYYFEINQNQPNPGQIDLEKSQFKYIKERTK